MAFAHAARAFVKAVAWEAEGDAPLRTLATYFDAFEYIPLVLLSDGPAKVAGLLSGYSDTLAPFANASGVFQASLRSTARTRASESSSSEP